MAETRDALLDPPAGNGAEPLNTTHLKAVAEALDGHRTGEIVFVLLQRDGNPPFDTRVVPTTELQAAERVAGELGRRRGQTYIVAGPYHTEKDPATLDPDVERSYAVILHDEHSNPTALDTGYWGGFDTVREIYLQFETIEGTLFPPEEPLRLRPKNTTDEDVETRTCPWVDAVFFSLGAVDKFLVPYYARLYGADAAKKMREDLSRGGTAARKKFVSEFPSLR